MYVIIGQEWDAVVQLYVVRMLLLLFRLMLLLFRMLWQLPVKRMAFPFSKSSPGVSRVRPDQRSVQYHNSKPCTFVTLLTKDDIPRPIQLT